MSLVVRTSSPPNTLVSAISNAVHEVDREQPVSDVITMDDILADSLSHQRFNMLLLSAFSGLALLLAAIGIYSVLAYSVRRRMREIGVRMALGAQRGDILRMILGQGTRLALIGTGIGIAAAFGADAVDVQPVVWRNRDRPSHISERGGIDRSGGVGGLLHSRAPCHESRSHCGAAVRVKKKLRKK